jgi:hypothetical protein
MFKWLRLCLLTTIILCTSCSRSESVAEEFDRKVGIRLCKGSKIEKFYLTKYDDETDFSYNARVIFPATCENFIIDQVIKISDSQCKSYFGCRFVNSNVWYYSFESDVQYSFIVKVRAT